MNEKALLIAYICQMPGHRLPKSNGKKCQDIDYPGYKFCPFLPGTA
jgi:hypothetical protein